MCLVDVTANADGTHSPHCYCGWSDDPHQSADSADRAAEAHQNRADT